MLQNGRTHVTVSASTAAKVVALLQRHDEVAQYLANNARSVHERLLCPDCIRMFWAETLQAYRAHFGFEETASTQFQAELEQHGFKLTPIDELGSWFIGRFIKKK